MMQSAMAATMMGSQQDGMVLLTLSENHVLTLGRMKQERIV